MKTTPGTMTFPYGRIPHKSACVASANGYGQHSSNGSHLWQITDNCDQRIEILVCSQCGSLFAQVKPPE